MSQKITFYPLGNAETCLIELNSGKKVLFDYANVYDGTDTDKRYNIKDELSKIKKFEVVMFSHPHEDHVKGASEFFYLEHASKYQSDDRAKIGELWLSAAFLLDTDLEDKSDAKIIRKEARHRLKNGAGIKVFGHPSALDNWLEENDVEYDDVADLIVNAGTKLTVTTDMEVFLHAPFSDDSEDVEDKNDPSIVMQVILTNDNKKTRLLITGDTSYQVIDKIVDITKSNKNDQYLKWDIYDIPHHCSHTGLNKVDDDGTVSPTENVLWLLGKAQKNAYMVASCDKITSKTSPPHEIAKEAYIKNTTEDVTFKVTMENIVSNSTKPSPVVFEIDSTGICFQERNIADDYLKKSAPRAG